MHSQKKVLENRQWQQRLEGDIRQRLLLDSKAEENERGVGKRQVVGTASCLYRTYKGYELRVQVGKRVVTVIC